MKKRKQNLVGKKINEKYSKDWQPRLLKLSTYNYKTLAKSQIKIKNKRAQNSIKKIKTVFYIEKVSENMKLIDFIDQIVLVVNKTFMKHYKTLHIPNKQYNIRKFNGD